MSVEPTKLCPTWTCQIYLVFPEPSQVKDLHCLPDITSIFLNWTIPGGDIESYELAVETFSRGGPRAVPLLAVSRADITLAKLTPNTFYQISVMVIGKNGIRGPAVKVHCNTLEEGMCLSSFHCTKGTSDYQFILPN